MLKRKFIPLITILFFLTFAALMGGCGGASEDDYDSLEAQVNSLKNEKEVLQNDLADLSEEKESLQATCDELADEIEALQTAYDNAAAELEKIKSVYPPREFSSSEELEAWLQKDAVSERPYTETAEEWVSRALEIQRNAAIDGYIVSMDYDYDQPTRLFTVYCTTVIGGEVWYWPPESDAVQREEMLDHID